MIFLSLLIAYVLGSEVLAAYATTLLALVIVYYVLYALGSYKLFAKAGKPGWWAFIPVVNEYQLYKISWTTSAFWMALALSVVGDIISNQEQTGALLAILAFIVAIAALYVEVKFALNLAKAYGKGTGFAIGLLLLHPIFIMVLGLGDSEYLGPQA